MLYGIMIGLIVITIYFAVRFFTLSASMKQADEDLKESIANLELNRSIKCASPNKDMEKLLITINQCLADVQKERIQHNKREKNFRRQIENISHDLRTPLTSMLGYIQLINVEHLEDEEKEYLEVIERKAKTLQRMVGNFYDLSRLELNDYAFQMEQIDMNKSLCELMLSYYQDFESRKIDVTMVTGKHPVIVLCDFNAVERIYMNLIQNSLKYAQSFLKVALYQQDKQVKIIFENDAPDLAEEDVCHLFERFYMKDMARTNQSTGLGLTITRHLVEAMEGTIEASLNDKVLQIILQFHMI